jgi:hypothetical protein
VTYASEYHCATDDFNALYLETGDRRIGDALRDLKNGMWSMALVDIKAAAGAFKNAMDKLSGSSIDVSHEMDYLAALTSDLVRSFIDEAYVGVLTHEHLCLAESLWSDGESQRISGNYEAAMHQYEAASSICRLA